MANIPVKVFHSTMTGAPTLSNAAGTLIAVLDAVLVNGWGLSTVDSISVASGIATVTRAAGHPFSVDMTSQVSGANTAEINGDQRVLSASATQYTFAAPGVPDGPIGGTIQHKVAPLGWTKVFSGTNLAAYKSSDVTATGCLLRVDDTGTGSARVIGCESMTDINTWSAKFPTEAQSAGGGWWSKYNAVSGSAAWSIVGDSRAFYFKSQSSTGTSATSTYFFGDIISEKSNDPYACVLAAANSSHAGSTTIYDIAYRNTASAFAARAINGVGTGISVGKFFFDFGPITVSGNAGSGTQYPALGDTALYLTHMHVIESASNPALRGRLPGMYATPQSVNGAGGFSDKQDISNAAGIPGRKIIAWTSYGSSGMVAFDITGPWR